MSSCSGLCLSILSTRLRTAMVPLLFAFLLAASAAAVPAAPPNYQAIESLIRQSKLDAADQQLQAILKQHPNDSRAEVLLGEVRIRQHKYPEGEALFLLAVKHNPRSPQACESLAGLYRDEMRLEEATAQYEKCATLVPANAPNLAALARLYMQQGQFEKSLAVTKNVAPDRRTAQMLPAIAADYVLLGNTEQAQPAIGEVLRLAPENPDLAPELATALLEHGMASDAQQLLKIAAPHQKITSSFLIAEAKAQAATGQKAEAHETISKALQQDPKSAEALGTAASLAAQSGDWDAAAKFLEAAFASGPPRIDLLQAAILVQLRRNDLQAAHDIAQYWYTSQPEVPDSALALAVVLVEGNHWGEAKPLLEKVLAKRPNDKRAVLTMGVVEYNASDLPAAQKYLSDSLGGSADDATAHYFLGLIAKQEGDVAAAIGQMQQTLAIRPTDARALGAVGELYLEQNDVAKARTALEQAVQQAPNEPQNHYELARVYNKLAMKQEAGEQLRIYEKLRPSRPNSPEGTPPNPPAHP